MTARRLILALVIAATIAGVFNTYADNAPVQRMATGIACGGHTGSACKARVTRIERTPFYQQFQFAEAQRRIAVRCTRSFYLFGDYSCTPVSLP